MKIALNRKLNEFIIRKDIVLCIILQIGTKLGTGHIIEFCENILYPNVN